MTVGKRRGRGGGGGTGERGEGYTGVGCGRLRLTLLLQLCPCSGSNPGMQSGEVLLRCMLSLLRCKLLELQRRSCPRADICCAGEGLPGGLPTLLLLVLASGETAALGAAAPRSATWVEPRQVGMREARLTFLWCSSCTPCLVRRGSVSVGTVLWILLQTVLCRNTVPALSDFPIFSNIFCISSPSSV